MGSIIAGFLLWVAIGSLLILLLRLFWPAYEAAHPARDFTLAMQVVRLAIGAGATISAGALVRRIAGTNWLPVLIFGSLLLLVSLFDHLQEPTWSRYPAWYHFVYLGYLIPLTLLGGHLGREQPGMSVMEGPVPPESSLDLLLVKTAWFTDSYQAELNQPAMSVIDLFQAVLGHHPKWIQKLLILRNRIAGHAGLAVPPDAAIRSFDRKALYMVGDCIGPWPIFHLSETELIAGRDNSHLDFRLSVLRLETPSPAVAFSTICNVHNWYGKAYLFFIIPFHKWGMRQLMRRALAAGRL